MKIIKGIRGCVFCKQPALDELDFGELKVTKNLRAHYYCLLFSETITQSGRDNQGILGFLPSDILSELCRSKQKQCYYCKEFGATAGCANKFCNIKFHLSCGMKKRTQHNFDSYVSYCHKHRKGSNVPVRIKRAISDHKCVICLENFQAKVDIANVIWADCCKADILLHLQCMKKLALSAGYFTKCPGCNNKNEFITTIKVRGVFVPERDASWELPRNAYSELYCLHETCDAEICHCPHGKKFSADRGKWKLFLCNLCGSFGTHQFCSQVVKEFVCSICDLADENNTRFDEGGNSSKCCKSNKNLHMFAKHTNTSTGSRPVRHKTANTNRAREVVENTDFDKKETDPLDDVIIVDCYDDANDVDELNKLTNFGVLSRISNEVTVKAGTILNGPTTSKIETKPQSQIVRRVATKSTTKLPYLKEKCSVLKKATDIERNNINPLDDILPQSSSATDTANKKEINETSKDFVKHDYISKHINKTSPDRYKSKFSDSCKERIATKSTTTLSFIKSEISNSENTIKLEKQTINSLDDFDDVIVVDSDEEENDANTSPFTVVPKAAIDKTDATLSRSLKNTLKSASSQSHIERKVAVKSTTKPPFFKRKTSDENISCQFQCEKQDNEYACINKIMKNCDLIIPSEERPIKKFKRNVVAKMSTAQKSTSRLSNLIKKVHTVIGSRSIFERNNFSMENDPPVDVTHSTSNIEALYSEENQLHYSIPLDVDGEIEFVNCPNFGVSAQVYNKRKASRCKIM